MNAMGSHTPIIKNAENLKLQYLFEIFEDLDTLSCMSSLKLLSNAPQSCALVLMYLNVVRSESREKLELGKLNSCWKVLFHSSCNSLSSIIFAKLGILSAHDQDITSICFIAIDTSPIKKYLLLVAQAVILSKFFHPILYLRVPMLWGKAWRSLRSMIPKCHC